MARFIKKVFTAKTKKESKTVPNEEEKLLDNISSFGGNKACSWLLSHNRLEEIS